MKLYLARDKQRYFYCFIFIIPFLLYWNSFNNEYAIDDNIVVDGVQKLESGIESIPIIFTSHYSQDATQSYGYRPVVLTTFAIEKESFNNLPSQQTPAEKKINDVITQANISHSINIILYSFTGVLLFYFLSLLFPEQNLLLPFLTTFVFLILPIHTEPVNNIKSRDELLVLLGIIGALIFYLKFSAKSNFLYLVAAMLCVFFALFSKKSAIALIGLVPVVLYFFRSSYRKIFISTGSIVVILAAAWFTKKTLLPISGHREMQYFENPLFFEGDFLDRIATGFYSSFFYLKMLIYPKEFSFYYGYSQIPLIDWTYYEVWLGLLIFVPLGIFGIMKFLKRDALGLGIVIWLGTMLGVINVVFPIVGVVADRFTYLFSVGYSIVVSVLLIRMFKLETTETKKKIKIPKAFVIVLVVVALLYGVKIINRNDDWENYLVLYKTDIQHLKNSAKANTLLANIIYPSIMLADNKWEKKRLVDESIMYYKRALAVDPNYASALNNLANLYISYVGNYEDALPLLKIAEKQNRKSTIANLAVAYYQLGNYKKAIPYLIKTIQNSPENNTIYESLFNIAEDDKLKFTVEKELLHVSPQLENTSIMFNLKLGEYYYKQKDFAESLRYYANALKLDPDNERLKNLVINLRNAFVPQ